ncbi:hypothetical protein JXA32_14725 [Candidatus Sumerlaeota bacterium]|nr:hypothetical protein [Candidatus Sumerlaeota bacterium]
MKRTMQITFLTSCLTLFLLGVGTPAFAQGPGGMGGMRGGSSNGNSSSSTEEVNEAVIEYDDETGQVIVIADEATNAKISRIIQSLDRPVPQVLIKVLFLEVTHTNDLDLGIEGSISFDTVEDARTAYSNFDLLDQTRGGFLTIIDDDVEVTLRAIAEQSKLEVLSRPSVLTRNNCEATITVGQEVPFITNSRITDDGQTINTVEYEDVGIILTVTPRIGQNGLVEMEVIPEISTISGETIAISDTVNAPVIAKRSAETRVVVENGHTVVIGGMMEDHDTETVQKIPLLGSIPLIGALFRRTVTEKSKTELLIFLTPHVVESAEDLRQVSQSEYKKAQKADIVFTEEQKDKYIDNLPRDETKRTVPQLIYRAESWLYDLLAF